MRNELTHLQSKIHEINNWDGCEVIVFKDYFFDLIVEEAICLLYIIL